MLHRIDHRLQLIRLALRIIWQATGLWMALWFGLLFIQGLIPAGIVLTTKWLVDSLTALLSLGTSDPWIIVEYIGPPAGAMGGLMLAQQLIGGANTWLSAAQAEYVQDHIKELIHEKAGSVEYAFFESADYYDQLEQANSQASSRTLSLLRNLGTLLRSTVTLTSIAVILIQYTWWIPVALVVSTLPAFVVLVRHNRKQHAWWQDHTAHRRLGSYYDVMLTLQAAAAELRINNLKSYFVEQYRTVRTLLREGNLMLIRKQAIAQLSATFLALVLTAVAGAWIVWRAVQGQATLGDLALFYQAFNQGQSLMGTFLQNIGQVYTNTLFLEHLFRFLDQKNQVKDPDVPTAFPAPIQQGIRFEDITFTYPGSQEPALQDFSLTLPQGQIVAIVGENGAGKSTFIKLLCRFYDPNQGAITVDGVNLKAFQQQDLRRQISVMFQSPMKYQFTAEQNIRLGDMEADNSFEEVQQAAKAAGAHEFILSLPQGYDTLLGRWFEGGRELSGGQWQRVALARAFLRQSQVLVLDEPTSAMDSWAEQDWLRRFRRLVRGRTALIVTHRFSTAMLADIIHVMEDGRVVESGTHAELLNLNGRYAASWNEQMRMAETSSPTTP